MSTKLRDVPNTKHKRIRQTRFAGGQTFDGQSALQITMNHFGEIRYIAVSRHDAYELAQELLRFASSIEVEDE